MSRCLFAFSFFCSVCSQSQHSLGSKNDLGGSSTRRKTRSCVLGFADVVGGHVASAAFCLPQPPLAVAVHVLELQNPQPLVGCDAQFVGAAGAEGVEGVVNLGGGKKANKPRHVSC